MFKRIPNFAMHAPLTRGNAVFRAIVKYGAIITEIKGKVNGAVFQGGTAGPQMKADPALIAAIVSGSKLTKADAGRVMNPQANIGLVSTTWKTLDDADRQTWVAAAPNYMFKNKFGEPYTASGFQVYMSLNTNLVAVGEPMVTVAPLPTLLIPTPPCNIVYGIGAAPKLRFTYEVLTGFKGVLYASVSQSAGKSLTKGRLKAIAVFAAGSGTAYDLDSQYQNIFGSIPLHGNVWFVFRCTELSTGQQNQSYTVQTRW